MNAFQLSLLVVITLFLFCYCGIGAGCLGAAMLWLVFYYNPSKD
jgi:hypothetical protein